MTPNPPPLEPTDLEAQLFAEGFATLPGLLAARACAEAAALWEADVFRKHVVMAAHGFGAGQYRYFADPMPPLVARLRADLYAALAPAANRWNEALGLPTRFPAALVDWRAACAAAGQTKPTPLLLRYGPGDYNRLHQDLYGELVFPFQVIVLLSRPGVDFDGGRLVITEQRARMQSRAEVIELAAGDAAVICVRDRPLKGPRGWSRARLRHGVSTLRSGERLTLGLIFHDAA